MTYSLLKNNDIKSCYSSMSNLIIRTYDVNDKSDKSEIIESYEKSNVRKLKMFSILSGPKLFQSSISI